MAPSDSLTYHVVFDVSRGLPQDWWAFLFPLAIVIVVLRIVPRNRKGVRLFRRIFLGFGIVLTLLFFVSTWATGCHLRNALVDGNVRVVEGIVDDFVPQSQHYKYPEQVVVVTRTGRYKYGYFSAIRTGGLTSSHGHIRNGTRVRIADRDGLILRLEVARNASGKPVLADGYPEVVFLPVVYARYGYTSNVRETKGMAVRLVDVVNDTRVRARDSCYDCEGVSGDAIAIVELFDRDVGQEPIRLELHANRELYEPFTDGDLVVDMTGLYPLPSDGQGLKSDYKARLMIGRRKPAPAAHN